MYEIRDSSPASIIQRSWRRADIYPIVKYPEGDLHEQLNVMQQHDDEEVRQLIVALLDSDHTSDPQDYIVVVPDEQVRDIHVASFFTAGIIELDDPSNPHAEEDASGNGDTELVDSLSSDNSDAIGTEELNVPMPVDSALLALHNARRFLKRTPGRMTYGLLRSSVG